MAYRKTSLHYIQVPSGFLQSRESRRLIRALEAKHSGGGHLAPYLMLCLQMYMARTAEGYYTKYDDDLIMDLADETGIDERLIEDTISTAAELNIINSSLFAKGIITSELIQEAYFAVMERLRRTSIKDAPYIIHKDSSERLSNSSEEYGRMKRFPIQSSEESSESSEISGQSSEGLHNSSAKQAHSSEECGDSSEECTCNVMYSKVEYGSVCVFRASEPTKIEIQTYFYLRNHANWKELAEEYWNSRTSTGWKTQGGAQIKDKRADVRLWEGRSKDRKPLFPANLIPIINALAQILDQESMLKTILSIKKASTSIGGHSLTLCLAGPELRSFIESNVQLFKPILNSHGIERLYYTANNHEN